MSIHNLSSLNPSNPKQIIVQLMTIPEEFAPQVNFVAFILNTNQQLNDKSQDVISRQNPKSNNQSILLNKAGNAFFIDCNQLDASQKVHLVAFLNPDSPPNAHLKITFRAKNGTILKEMSSTPIPDSMTCFKAYALDFKSEWQMQSIGEFSKDDFECLTQFYLNGNSQSDEDDFDFDAEFGNDDYFTSEFPAIIEREVIEAEFEEINPNGIQKRQSTALKPISTALIATEHHKNNYKNIAPRKILSLELPKMLYAREVYTFNLNLNNTLPIDTTSTQININQQYHQQNNHQQQKLNNNQPVMQFLANSSYIRVELSFTPSQNLLLLTCFDYNKIDFYLYNLSNCCFVTQISEDFRIWFMEQQLNIQRRQYNDFYNTAETISPYGNYFVSDEYVGYLRLSQLEKNHFINIGYPAYKNIRSLKFTNLQDYLVGLFSNNDLTVWELEER